MRQQVSQHFWHVPPCWHCQLSLSWPIQYMVLKLVIKVGVALYYCFHVRAPTPLLSKQGHPCLYLEAGLQTGVSGSFWINPIQYSSNRLLGTNTNNRSGEKVCKDSNWQLTSPHFAKLLPRHYTIRDEHYTIRDKHYTIWDCQLQNILQITSHATLIPNTKTFKVVSHKIFFTQNILFDN